MLANIVFYEGLTRHIKYLNQRKLGLLAALYIIKVEINYYT